MLYKAPLTEREKAIMKHRLFGFNHVTLQKTGEKFGVTRERIRQIESVIVSKLYDNL